MASVLYVVFVKYVKYDGFPGGSDGKDNAGDLCSDPWVGKSPGEGNGYPLQYYCLEGSVDRKALWAAIHGVRKRQTQLSD